MFKAWQCVPLQCAKCLRLLGFVLGLAGFDSLSLGLQACSRGVGLRCEVLFLNKVSRNARGLALC